MKNFFDKLYLIAKIVIIMAPFLILAWLIKKDLVLDGHLEMVYDFKRPTAMITAVFPENRLTNIQKGGWQAIKQEPVYFEVRLPQKFETAKVEIAFQNANQPLVQVGLKTLGEDEWSYDLKPLENQLLDKLNWFKIEDERGTIWQKTKKYLGWDQFFDQIDSLNNLAAYHFPLNRKFYLPNYRPQNQDRFMTKTIRGQHSFYTYIKNELLDFTFTIQDMNRAIGPDLLTIKVYNQENEKIYQKMVADDGIVNNFDGISARREVDLKMLGLEEGVYRLELNAGDDIFFRKIRTKQQYLTFIDRLYLVDNVEYSDGFVDLNYQPITIYSTIPRLGFETAHPEGLQTVGLGKNQTLALSETHKSYFVTPLALPTYIYSPKNDLKIFGRGLLAIDQKMFFNPEIYNLRDFSITPEINYLVTEYQTPKNNQGWKIGTVKFDLKNASIVNRKLRFMVSSPELNQSNANLPLEYIKVVLDKKPLSYWETFAKIIKYIREKF